jgi:hypothetical protein
MKKKGKTAEVKPRGYRLADHQSTSLHVYSTAPDHGRAVSNRSYFCLFVSLQFPYRLFILSERVLKDFFLFLFFPSFCFLSPLPIFFFFFFSLSNKQAQTEVGDRRSPDVTDLAEVLHLYSLDFDDLTGIDYCFCVLLDYVQSDFEREFKNQTVRA